MTLAAFDADSIIIKEAISRVQNQSDLVLVGEDIDLLVLLIVFTTEENIIIF